MTLYKVTNEDGSPCNGGSGKWLLPSNDSPGEWMPVVDDIAPCERGYHLCDGELQLLRWLGPAIWVAECRGKRIDDDNKIVVEQARLVERCEHWDETAARLFVADCAEHVLHIYERDNDGEVPRMAIHIAREYALGIVDATAWRAASNAAWDAAWRAAWSAAESAAESAARSIAWRAASAASSSVAENAARNAAENAAGSAASIAARRAAESAERTWQATRLLWYLDGCPLPVPSECEMDRSVEEGSDG